MTENTLFHFEDDRPSIEDLSKPNGGTYWFEGDLREAMEYQSDESFRKVVMKAMQACLSLSIQTEDNFVRTEDGQYKFTRFACYLIAMNGDPKKSQVAAAQLYFAALAETYNSHLEHAEGIDRMLIREEVSDGEKTLASTAKSHGVESKKYGFFKDAGYRGMYNMSLKQLKAHKGIAPKEALLDRMGKEELAAHLFRITQTSAKIKNDGIRGQKPLEDAAKRVGKQVRKTMIDISGKTPESLQAAEPIKEVRKKIKGTNKNFKKLDDKKS